MEEPDPIVLDNIRDRRDQINLIRWPLPLSASLAPSMIQTIAPETTRRIFRRMAPAIQSEQSRGESIIARLRTLYPPLLEVFEAKTDQIDNFTLRLFHQDKTVPKTAYLAISYCWNDKTFDGLGADLVSESGNMRLPISPAMFQSAIGERQLPTEGLWLDQICIDQSSAEEKSIAIPSMDIVYRNATRCVVCLDDVELSVEELTCLLGEIKPDFEDPTVPEGDFPHLRDDPPYVLGKPAFLSAYMKICASKWFTRAWCSHELRLSKWHRFYVNCPSGVLAGEELTVGFTGIFLWWMAALTVSFPPLSESMRTSTSIIMRTLDMEQMIRQSLRLYRGEYASESNENTYTLAMLEAFELGAGGNPTLPDMLRSCDSNRDRVSIVLNLLGHGLRLKYNPELSALEQYKHEKECFRKLLIVAIAAGDPVALCTTGHQLRVNPSSPPASWLCVPTIKDLGSQPSYNKFTPIDTGFITMDHSHDVSWITLDGYVPTEKLALSENYLRAATSIVQVAKEIGLGKSPNGTAFDAWGTAPDYSAWLSQAATLDRFCHFIETVACVLQLGTQWAANTAKKCGFPTRYEDSLVSSLTGFALDDRILESGSWISAMPGIACVDAVLRFSNWLMAWGQNTSYYPLAENWGPRMYTLEKQTFVTFEPVGNDKHLEIFVPRCLHRHEYARLARVWVLEKRTGGLEKVEGVLRGKTRMFGPEEIVFDGADIESWRLVGGQKVFGLV